MQVIGFNFEKIQAEKKNQIKGKVQISSNIDIKSVTEEKINVVKDKPALKLRFSFIVEYKPDIAEILLDGFVLLLVEKDEAKNALKRWKKKEIPNEIRIPIFNLILTKANLRALQLEEELSLPTHVPLPRLKSQQEIEQESPGKTKYAG
ncbi:MAG: hypothetical protein AABX71_00520 [Nanoarchaeota archaeon]